MPVFKQFEMWEESDEHNAACRLVVFYFMS